MEDRLTGRIGRLGCIAYKLLIFLTLATILVNSHLVTFYFKVQISINRTADVNRTAFD